VIGLAELNQETGDFLFDLRRLRVQSPEQIRRIRHVANNDGMDGVCDTRREADPTHFSRQSVPLTWNKLPGF